MDESLLELRNVIAEAVANSNPHTVMMEIITYFAELGFSPQAIVDQLKILGYLTC